MVHAFKNNGYNIVMDVNSGAIHVVDELVYDIVNVFKDLSESEIREKFKDAYPEEEISEAYEEVCQ